MPRGARRLRHLNKGYVLYILSGVALHTIFKIIHLIKEVRIMFGVNGTKKCNALAELFCSFKLFLF